MLKIHGTPHTSTEISKLPRTLYWSPEETPKVDLENDDPKFAAKQILTLIRRCHSEASPRNTKRRAQGNEFSPLLCPITDYHMNLFGIAY